MNEMMLPAKNDVADISDKPCKHSSNSHKFQISINGLVLVETGDEQEQKETSFL